jgi:hypothetical protein
VPNAKLGAPWIRLGLRGERVLGDATQLYFRYHLTGADPVRVRLVDRTAKTTHFVDVKGLTKDQWAETFTDFAVTGPGPPSRGDRVNEIQFLLPPGAELVIDDMILYEPGP